MFMVFNATFNTISAISGRSVFICGGNRSTWKKPPTWRKSHGYILWLSFPCGIYYHDLITSLRSEVCAHFYVFKSVTYLRYITVSDYPLGIFTLSLIQGPGWLNELVIGIPNNSDSDLNILISGCLIFEPIRLV